MSTAEYSYAEVSQDDNSTCERNLFRQKDLARTPKRILSSPLFSQAPVVTCCLVQIRVVTSVMRLSQSLRQITPRSVASGRLSPPVMAVFDIELVPIGGVIILILFAAGVADARVKENYATSVAISSPSSLPLFVSSG